MIDRPALIAWRSKAPWPSLVQIEQDLLLSRLMIEIARDEVLGPELTMRGGTCLHKLHLPRAWRYSEDLDYVRSTHTGIKPYTHALGVIAERVGLTVSSRQRSGQMVQVYLDTQPTVGIGRIRIKIEMNIAETESHRPRKTLRYVLTGSLAAERIAAHAPPRLAMIYVDRPEEAAERLGLREVESGANVLLAAAPAT